MKWEVLLLLFVSVIISGCGQRIYIDREVKVNIPVPCEVKNPRCPNLKGLSGSDVIIELGRCIDQYEENVKVCQNNE
jgi:hypothetical protein